jgi:hypothetical protein
MQTFMSQTGLKPTKDCFFFSLRCYGLLTMTVVLILSGLCCRRLQWNMSSSVKTFDTCWQHNSDLLDTACHVTACLLVVCRYHGDTTGSPLGPSFTCYDLWDAALREGLVSTKTDGSAKHNRKTAACHWMNTVLHNVLIPNNGLFFVTSSSCLTRHWHNLHKLDIYCRQNRAWNPLVYICGEEILIFIIYLKI